MAKKKQKHKAEFTYDPIKDNTLCIIWEGMSIIHSKTIEGKISKEDHKNFKEEYKKS